MDYAPVVERIRAKVPALKVVDFAVSLEALKEKGIAAYPAGFVLPRGETPAANKAATGVLHQAVRFRFRHYLFVKFAGDALGGKAKDLLDEYRAPLFEALYGWKLPSPDPIGDVLTVADGEIEADGADVAQLANGVLVWFDQFAFDGYYRRLT